MFLKPLLKSHQEVWFSSQPLGKDALAKIWTNLSETAPVEIDASIISATCAVRHLDAGMGEILVKNLTGICKSDVEHLLSKTSMQEYQDGQLSTMSGNGRHIVKKRLVEEAELEDHCKELAVVTRFQQCYTTSVPILQERILGDLMPTKLLAACIVVCLSNEAIDHQDRPNRQKERREINCLNLPKHSLLY